MNSITIPKQLWPAIKRLSTDQAGEVLQACINYAEGDPVNLSSQAAVNAFEPLRKAIEFKRHRERVNTLFTDSVEKEAREIKIKDSRFLTVVHKRRVNNG